MSNTTNILLMEGSLTLLFFRLTVVVFSVFFLPSLLTTVDSIANSAQ